MFIPNRPADCGFMNFKNFSHILKPQRFQMTGSQFEKICLIIHDAFGNPHQCGISLPDTILNPLGLTDFVNNIGFRFL